VVGDAELSIGIHGTFVHKLEVNRILCRARPENFSFVQRHDCGLFDCEEHFAVPENRAFDLPAISGEAHGHLSKLKTVSGNQPMQRIGEDHLCFHSQRVSDQACGAYDTKLTHELEMIFPDHGALTAFGLWSSPLLPHPVRDLRTAGQSCYKVSFVVLSERHQMGTQTMAKQSDTNGNQNSAS